MTKKEENKVVYQGVRWLDLLTLLFIGLKLTGFIEWSWVWVLLPSWSIWGFAIIAYLINWYKAYRISKDLKKQLDTLGEVNEDTWEDTLKKFEEWKNKLK